MQKSNQINAQRQTKMDRQARPKKTTPCNTGLAKVAVHYSAETFVVNKNLVLRINPEVSEG
jgi:hypothetical protein